nr:cytochrome b N-terminal domain-containing protein [Agromyces intestinalis]
MTATLRGRTVPLHWSNLFGVVSMACLVVLFVTGIFLMFVYSPSSESVIYAGGYAPLRGVEMSKALESTLAVSFEVPGGLLMRQAHHWAGLLLPAALIMQLLVSFFTGAFRRPRQWSWVLLFLVFVMALVAGWSGYALPDDLLSGTGLRIVEGIVLGIPVVGTWVSALLFGGEFPGQVIEHLYLVHVLIAPAALVIFLALRIRLAFRLGPAQFAGPGRTERNVVGVPVLPQLAVRAGALLLIVIGLILGIAATVTIAPVWLFGPSSPGDASAGSQPDWYTGFLDGALRLVPPGWEVEWFGRTWTLAVIAPLLVVGGFLVLAAVYPFLEAWITGDRREHHLLDRPRSAPGRTGIGVAAIVFYGALWGAASADLIATHFHVGLEATIWMFRVLVVAGPLVGFEVARRVCIALQRKDEELLLHGYETGRIVRLPGGEYVEVHAPLTEYERWRLIDRGTASVPPPRSGIRRALFGLFFEDRLAVRPEPAPSAEERPKASLLE